METDQLSPSPFGNEQGEPDAYRNQDQPSEDTTVGEIIYPIDERGQIVWKKSGKDADTQPSIFDKYKDRDTDKNNDPKNAPEMTQAVREAITPLIPEAEKAAEIERYVGQAILEIRGSNQSKVRGELVKDEKVHLYARLLMISRGLSLQQALEYVVDDIRS
ncbi:MAG: hypothetical protein UX04_C0003G0053 [Microgenomates group bacterium GW2011_GWF2_45_18]|nr:MAG: hypothetical protein UW18_C0002G0053 [Microgenomates group bacterium GW2011_GWF1_44_10]KKU01781.1 MAG: hypothetical protein UX04_C0003G0053 [Microgenomates group bacterium GW2011_GWF2_45_18]OGJ40627.1 MAG: hypothetical protein A2378_02845 [Candidatus Pacebacteria bacterium RIFOXYB1_FULL_44_10]HAU98915.1 hypothetical protein [Candidatus Paceibacterota bacterium]HAX01128.1 hypothetical protein [Candidatus Paceibacterota bacterium]